MSTTTTPVERSLPMITTHAAEQWENRVPDAKPLGAAVHDTIEVESQVNGDTALYHAEHDMLLVVRAWKVVTVLHADHDRMDTRSMRPCSCGCLVDQIAHDVCPRCEKPAQKTIRVGGGWS